ncbi:MAG: hypothetical protein MR018_08745 [Clostridiales bacterium]|nr:hypothetical protein [Clostridiales bacterium]
MNIPPYRKMNLNCEENVPNTEKKKCPASFCSIILRDGTDVKVSETPHLTKPGKRWQRPPLFPGLRVDAVALIEGRPAGKTADGARSDAQFSR